MKENNFVSRAVVIFCVCVGVIVGAGSYFSWAATLKSKPSVAGGLDAAKMRGISHDLEELDAQLKLSLRQKEEVTKILKREKEQKVVVMKDAAQKLRDVSAAAENDIEALLTEPQRMKLEYGPGETAPVPAPAPEITDAQANEFLKTFH